MRLMLSSQGAKALAKRAPRTQQGRPYKAASLTNATRVSWVTWQNSSATLTTITGASLAATQAQRTRPWSQATLEREASGRSGEFMPQISRNKSVKVNNKTCKKELQVAKNSTWATFADKQRRRVDWQRQGHRPQTKRQAQTAETASATKKITSQYWV